MAGGEACGPMTWRRPLASSACRLPSCGFTPAKAGSARPSRASAGCSSRTTLPPTCAGFTLPAGKRR